jgi:YD repeat-containing protein
MTATATSSPPPPPDLDSNRVAFTLGSDSYAVTFDRTDAATGTRKNGGASVAFAYDRYGNLLTDAAAGTTAGVVTYAYDLADRTTSITRASTTTSLVLDALGRPRLRTTGSSTDTLSYEGASNAVVRVANTGGGGTTTDGLVDAAGTRLGTRVGSGSVGAWLVPDLHRSIAAGLAPAATAISDALRYDGYGVTLAVHPAGGSGATAHWRYQGRLDLVPGPVAAGTPAPCGARGRRRKGRGWWASHHRRGLPRPPRYASSAPQAGQWRAGERLARRATVAAAAAASRLSAVMPHPHWR